MVPVLRASCDFAACAAIPVQRRVKLDFGGGRAENFFLEYVRLILSIHALRSKHPMLD